MSGKLTFRSGSLHPTRGGWSVDVRMPSATDDPPADSDLAELVDKYRAMSRMREHEPSAQDVRATLRALTRISQRRLGVSLRALDSTTNALLDEASLRLYRKRFPLAMSAPGIIYQRSTWNSQHVQLLAMTALRHFKTTRGGRPRHTGNDLPFARELLRHWAATRTRRATISTADSPFCKFALEQFKRIDRQVEFETIRLTLLKARKLERGGFPT